MWSLWRVGTQELFVQESEGIFCLAAEVEMHPCSMGPNLKDHRICRCQPLAAMCPGLPCDLHGSWAT